MKAFIFQFDDEQSIVEPDRRARRRAPGSGTAAPPASRRAPAAAEADAAVAEQYAGDHGASAATDLTDRSMLPAMMTMARPIAMTPT